MDDRLTAGVVQIQVDATGKLWVNVDGCCVLRIGHCAFIQFDDQIHVSKVVHDDDGDYLDVTSS